MSYPLLGITVTDEHGTDYTDLFDDLDLDDYELLGSVGITSVDVEIPNTPRSPRASLDGPLGTLIDRWIDSHTTRDDNCYGWQYLDASDTHTIAWEEGGDVAFRNIYGYTVGGGRAYRLRAIASALELGVEFKVA